MTKWDYISAISKSGSRYGGGGGVLDLLSWCGKQSTQLVTLEEAKEFWETRPLSACAQAPSCMAQAYPQSSCRQASS